MNYNNTNIEKIAWKIVEDMSREDLEQFVCEDMIYTMENDEEIFNINAEIYKEETNEPS